MEGSFTTQRSPIKTMVGSLESMPASQMSVILFYWEDPFAWDVIEACYWEGWTHLSIAFIGTI